MGYPANGSWAEFSKQTLLNQVKTGNRIHFDLTHIDDLAGVVQGTGQQAGKVTSIELRFLRDNWSKFERITTFYRNGNPVRAPW
jgi:hypothetical protein